MWRRMLCTGWKVGVLLAVAVPAATAQDDSFEWSGEIARGRTLEVRGITGEIRAVLTRGRTAQVVAYKHGRARDFDDVEIQVVEDRGDVIVCAIYHPRRGASCDSRDWGNGSGDRDDRNIDVSVEFEVRVPEGVDFDGSMVTGNVEAEGLRSNVSASSVTGDVIVSTTGVAWGSTVSGNIDIEMGSDDWDDLSFSTVSGDITITLPDPIDADIEFASLSGDFRSDFDLRVIRSKDKFIGEELEARLGRGGRELSFKTVSGDVRLRRAGGRVR